MDLFMDLFMDFLWTLTLIFIPKVGEILNHF